MKPHQLRVIEESRELKERLTKLLAFISENPIFLDLSIYERDRLRRQSEAMQTYANILNERIANFD